MKTHAIIFVQWRMYRENKKKTQTAQKKILFFSHLMDMTFGILTLEYNVILLVLPLLQSKLVLCAPDTNRNHRRSGILTHHIIYLLPLSKWTSTTYSDVMQSFICNNTNSKTNDMQHIWMNKHIEFHFMHNEDAFFPIIILWLFYLSLFLQICRCSFKFHSSFINDDGIHALSVYAIQTWCFLSVSIKFGFWVIDFHASSSVCWQFVDKFLSIIWLVLTFSIIKK